MANAVGRPKLDDPRNKVVQFRVSEFEFDELERAAERGKVRISEFCRNSTIDLAMAINAGELDDEG